MKYSIKDISVIIATYNRPEDIKEALKSIKPNLKKLREVIIIDQSTNGSTRNIVKKINGKKIKYYHSTVPSLTVARNTGIKKLSSKSKIAIFVDDDVTLHKNYFKGIIDVFNRYPNAKGAGGYFLPKIKINRLEMMLRRLFFVEHYIPNKASVCSPYGAVYPSILNKVISSEWTAGFNMAFKREVLDKNKFDENFFRYGLGEDFEFTTRLNRRYPCSLFITPFAGIIHRVSEVERMPIPKQIYMNHVNHLYIQKKNFNGFKGIVSTGIALTAISLLHLAIAIIMPKKKNLLKCRLHFSALFYCLKRLGLIRKGQLEIPVS